MCFLCECKNNSVLRRSQCQSVLTRMSSVQIQVAEWCKARVCSWLLAGVAGLNPAGGMDVCVVVSKGGKKKQKEAKCRIIKTKNQVRMKCRVQENTKRNPAGGMDGYVVSCVCCVSCRYAKSRSLIQRSRAVCVCVWPKNHINEEAQAGFELLRHRRNKYIIWLVFV